MVRRRMTGPRDTGRAELAARLATGAISLEEFLWAAAAHGLDRREAARLAVESAATATPGSRTIPGSAGEAPGPAGGGPPDGVLRIALPQLSDGMDPAVATYGSGRLVIEQLYSTLMAVGPDGRPYPDLAEWVEVSPDATTYTFGLVPGVEFHDGSPVTADDVVFTFERLLELGEAYHFDPWLTTVAGVAALDPVTVRFRLTQPTAPMLERLAISGTGIVPRAAVTAGRDLIHDPIGSGPFRLAQPWAGGDAPIRLARHTASARGGAPFTPRLAGLEFQAITAEDDRVAALLAGTIDLDSLAGPATIARVAATPGFQVHATPDSRWHWISVNCRHAPLNDARVRRALSLAINRSAIIEEVWSGWGVPLPAGPVAPWSWAHAAGLAGVPEEGDPAAARQLLREAGVPDGYRVAITVTSTQPRLIEECRLIAADLCRAGLDGAVDVVDYATWFDRVIRAGDFQLSGDYWGSPIWDPDDSVSMNTRSGGRWEAGALSDTAFDASIDAGYGTVVNADRQTIYRNAQERMLDVVPIIPTVQPHMLRTSSARLAGFVATPCAQLRTLRDAWIGGL
jgi:peptide/nickel transport system substrate-binding protein